MNSCQRTTSSHWWRPTCTSTHYCTWIVRWNVEEGTAPHGSVPTFTFILGLIFRYFLLLYLLCLGFTQIVNVRMLVFILNGWFRMEEVHLRNWSSQDKVLGIIALIVGAFFLMLYNGPFIFKTHLSNICNQILPFSQQLNWILEGIFYIVDSLFISMWYIYQVVFPFQSNIIFHEEMAWILCFPHILDYSKTEVSLLEQLICYFSFWY